jgi:hypothetical protein
VLKSIEWEELLSRWQKIRNRADAIQHIEQKGLRLALKMPSIIDSIPFLAEALPQARFVIIVRDGRDVVRSIVKKEWLTDAGLKDNYWPYKTIDGHLVPAFVDDSVASSWKGMNAATRACYLWRRDVELGLNIAKTASLKDRLHVVMYEELRQQPREVMTRLADFLSTGLSELTELGVRAVRPPGAVQESSTNYQFLDQVDQDELRRFSDLSARLGYR